MDGTTVFALEAPEAGAGEREVGDAGVEFTFELPGLADGYTELNVDSRSPSQAQLLNRVSFLFLDSVVSMLHSTLLFIKPDCNTIECQENQPLLHPKWALERLGGTFLRGKRHLVQEL